MRKKGSKFLKKSGRFKYSDQYVLETLILYGECGFSALRDKYKLAEKIKISPPQLNQRVSRLNPQGIRDYLIWKFKKLKKRKENKICYLIVDKTFFSLPEHVNYGYKCYIKKGDKKYYKFGEEYSIALAYFPNSDSIHLLDWERIDKKRVFGEFSASLKMLKRIILRLRSERVRIKAIVGDKLYFNRIFFELAGLKEVCEGFISKPKRNSRLKEEEKLLEEFSKKYYQGKIKLEGKRWEIYEIGGFDWKDISQIKKYSEAEIGNYRLILLKNEKGEKYYYVSNCSYLVGTVEIVKAYKYRWKIENFFQVAKNNFGKYPITTIAFNREIRLITKLIGITKFFRYLRRRRIKLNGNRGRSILNLIFTFILELKLGVRIYKNGKKYYRPPPDPLLVC